MLKFEPAEVPLGLHVDAPGPSGASFPVLRKFARQTLPPPSMDDQLMTGDVLLDVLRSDSANLLDIDSLADFLDDWVEDGARPPGAMQGVMPMAGSHGQVVTTINQQQLQQQQQQQQQPPLKNEAPIGTGALRSTSSGDSSVNTKASGSKPDGPTAGAYSAMMFGGAAAAAAAAAAQQQQQEQEAAGRERKKRTRNQQQMEHNRVAQQKYRERKKNENAELQHAVDMLTMELAAMKALEVRAAELESHNAVLNQQVMAQAQRLQTLEVKVAEQDATISTQAAQLSGQLGLLTSQQKMILDQHQKIQLQEEIIASLKDRLKESVDRAWNDLEATAIDPTTVCRRMHEAVREALVGAKDLEGLQDTLAKLPEHIVVEICKNIMCACRELFPQLAERMNIVGQCGKFPMHCGGAAGHVLPGPLA